MTLPFSLTPTAPKAPKNRTPRIHMEGHWDDNGPFGICGNRPARPKGERHHQTMTTTWGDVTCIACQKIHEAEKRESPGFGDPGSKVEGESTNPSTDPA